MPDKFLKSLERGQVFYAIVKTGAAQNSVTGFDEAKSALKISVKAFPEKGKANAELLKLLEKESGKRLEIISGYTSKRKMMRVL